MAARKRQSPSTKDLQKSVKATRTHALHPHATGGRLAGKTAVVTGASRGIGLATACALAAESCRVIMTGRDPRTLAEAAKKVAGCFQSGSMQSRYRVRPEVCDVRDPDSVNELFALVRDTCGQLDVLVNNAGISQPMTPTEETSIELWRDMIDTNLTGTFLCSKAAVPLMPRGASIVNVLSVAAKVAFPNFSAYNSSKFGALGLTLTLREEMKQRGIRVTALMPGATDTAIWQQISADAPRNRMIDEKTVAHMIVETVLLSPIANMSEMLFEPILGPL